ncbi:hypothetical protein EPUS_03092 [Endocarpon pusillum Z07020]|uniref:Uncharacterized protein n=1 Tax=Endocarpon pusillum (strain Z07020 / HMAS-L-300199) TaxID=1263415 RepID=U1HRW7_ENDPU|nr:uncharacterized protein EPUS_03092 [Endocarpon pusillum Z07020]ERF73260.1 hypothetical protein EPUS_03092 [Endocarpon pusillum Z07020]
MSSNTKNTKPQETTTTTKMPTTASTSKEGVRDMLLEKYPPLIPESGSALEITPVPSTRVGPFPMGSGLLGASRSLC